MECPQLLHCASWVALLQASQLCVFSQWEVHQLQSPELQSLPSGKRKPQTTPAIRPTKHEWVAFPHKDQRLHMTVWASPWWLEYSHFWMTQCIPSCRGSRIFGTFCPSSRPPYIYLCKPWTDQLEFTFDGVFTWKTRLSKKNFAFLVVQTENKNVSTPKPYPLAPIHSSLESSF